MLHVVHHPGYVAPGRPGSGHDFNKYGLVMIALEESGAAMTVHAPDPMPRHWLDAVHDPDYVSEVLGCAVPAAKEKRIGFPGRDVAGGTAGAAPRLRRQRRGRKSPCAL